MTTRAWLRRVARFAERTLAIVGAFFIVYHLFFEVTYVATGSMSPLLYGAEEGHPDWALIEKASAGKAPPSRFQVVSFLNDDGLEIAKRVVAFPGETVAVVSRTLVIDGKPVASPEGVGRGKGYVPAGSLHTGASVTVPAGHVFLLGDDSQDSEDSRFMGPLPVTRVRGRALLRIWPLSRLKWLL
jgi:signal peptidase I